jgi:hypothetical protein
VYNERPRTCRAFPEKPIQTLETPCSYWFENRVHGRVVRFGGNGSPYPGLHIEDATPAIAK